jgi:hypothetical protein
MTIICWCAIHALTRRVVAALDQIKLGRISHGDCGLNFGHVSSDVRITGIPEHACPAQFLEPSSGLPKPNSNKALDMT